MKLIFWVAAIVSTIGVRGFASLMIVPPLLGGVWYLMARRERQTSLIQAATERVRGLGG